MEVAHGYLLVHDVPFVNASCEVNRGTLVFALELTADIAVRTGDHTAYMIGEIPCNAEGAPLTKILNNSNQTPLAPGIVADHYFSAKPRGEGYKDYFEKVNAYINMLSGYAQVIDPVATARVFKPYRSEVEESPFVYADSATSRAGIAVATSRIAGQRIAIVGLGGTGAYVLDLLAKTPVAEIHLYDGDQLHQHNAFRYPGAVAFDALESQPLKVDYLAAEYGKLHRGIRAHALMIDEANVDELAGYDAVFVCVDSSRARRLIAERLRSSATVMFDTGMGVRLSEGAALFGIVRLSTLDRGSAANAMASMPLNSDDDDNLYGTNVQVADLNCLNAYLAVEAWKKRFGFYYGSARPHLTTYTTGSGVISANEAVQVDE